MCIGTGFKEESGGVHHHVQRADRRARRAVSRGKTRGEVSRGQTEVARVPVPQHRAGSPAGEGEEIAREYGKDSSIVWWNVETAG